MSLYSRTFGQFHSVLELYTVSNLFLRHLFEFYRLFCVMLSPWNLVGMEPDGLLKIYS